VQLELSMSVSLLIAALAIGAPGAKDAPKKESAILGMWEEEKDPRFEKAGVKSPLNGIRHEFTADGKWIRHWADGFDLKPIVGEFKSDETKSPATFDGTATTQLKKGPATTTYLGIYKVEGDTLTLCIRSDGERPKSFEKIEDGRRPVQTRLIMKRVQKKE
jgi:uncharacterized protein (TIGR03067 family)